MRQIVIMSVGAVILLAGAVTLVVVMGEDAQFTGNPLESWSVGEKAERVASKVKEQVLVSADTSVQQRKNDEFNVKMPPVLNKVAFGASVEKMAAIYPPKWRKQTSGNTIFAHYPDESFRKCCVFEFDDSGLATVGIRVKPADQQKLGELYNKAMKQAASRFGDSTDEPRRRWRGEELTAVLKKQGDYISLQYTPTNY